VQTPISILWLHRRACARVDVVALVPALVYDPASAALLVAEAHTILDDAACFSRMTMPILSCLCGEDDARVHRLLTSPCGSSAVAEDAARRGVA
jgi:hypothetical protein